MKRKSLQAIRYLKKNSVYAVLCLLFILTSCHQMIGKTRAFGNNVREHVSITIDEIFDRVFPRFDAFHPDTKANKKRFDEFIKIQRTADIRQIYCYDDAIGIDADYMFSFHCSPKSAKKIIQQHHLIPDPSSSDFASGLQDDFPWWNKEKIATLERFSWKGEHEYFKYFWYDSLEKKGYFFDFDM